MNFSIFSATLVVSGCIGVFLVGVILIQRGRWPARIGTTLHCRKCDYILTGLTADRCPECGESIQPGNVVSGERHRLPKLIFAGVLLALLGLFPLGVATVGSVKQVDWIRYRPTVWLIDDLKTPLASDTAWREIQRRIAVGSVSESHLHLLSEKALQFQKQPMASSSMTDSALLQFLGKRYVDGKLTAAQKDQFFDNALKVTISARPLVGSQDSLPYWISATGRGPDGWWVRSRRVEWHIDDGPAHPLDNGSSGSSFFIGGATGSSLPAGQPVGKHRLHMKVELAACRPGSSNRDNGPFERTVTRELETDFEVIPGHASITLVTVPTAEVLHRLFTFNLSVNGNSLSANIDVKASLVDLAFDVFIRTGGKEHLIGGVNFKNNIDSGYGTGGDTDGYPQPFPDRVDVILRSSETVARSTTNLTQIWKGEIVFKDVPVKLPATRPAQTLPAQQ